VGTYALRICKNGHLLKQSGHKSGSPGYCPDCGEKGQSLCTKCGKNIEVNQYSFSGAEDIPQFCKGCGEPFPWTDTVEEHTARSGDFLDIAEEEITSQFHHELVREINLCYQVKANEATYVLYRKLLENLVYDSLRRHIDDEDIEEIFNTNEGRREGFKHLLSVLQSRQNELAQYSTAIDSKFISKLRDFKEEGDSSAHSTVNLVTDEELEENSEEATYLARILFELREEVYAGVAR